MAGIKDEVYSKYGIDIDADRNIITKKYRYTDPKASDADVEKLIEKAKSNWQRTVDSGTMQKQIDEAKVRLEESPKFERLLRDSKLRVKVAEYYNSGSGSSVDLSHASDYFEIVSTTKSLHLDDVDFYIRCFPEYRKNKKLIIEMLNKTYKINLKAKEESDDVSLTTDDGKGNKKKAKKAKKQSGAMIVNKFSADTVSIIIQIDKLHKECKNLKSIQDRYPEVQEDLATFLGIKGVTTPEEYAKYVDEHKKQAYTVKQEFGNEYGIVLDIYNRLDELLDPNKHKDVHDSFNEFRVLLYYPGLTPYMYPLEDAKKKTLEKLFSIAKDVERYGFKNIDEFISKYYVLVYQNFNIDDTSISAMLKAARKNAEKVLKNLDKNTKTVKEDQGSKFFNVLYGFAFWPLYILFFLFEIIKFIVDHLKKVAVVSVIPFIILQGIFIKNHSSYDFTILKDLFSTVGRLNVFQQVIGSVPDGISYTIISTLFVIAFIAAKYLALPLSVSYILICSSSSLKKRVDWIGIERTFKLILQSNRKLNINIEKASKKAFKKKMISNAVINIIFTILIVIATIFISDYAKGFGDSFSGFMSRGNSKQEEEVVEEENTVENILKNVGNETTAEQFGHSGYQIVNCGTYVDYETAVKVCADKGGHLATFASEEELNYVLGLIEDDGIYFVGAEKDDNDYWSWPTGETMMYTNWIDQDASGKQSVVDKQGMRVYNAVTTTDTIGFIFEKDFNKPSSVKYYEVRDGETAIIRTGAGKSFDQITELPSYAKLLGTGNDELSSAGNVWHEVLLDYTSLSTAWVYGEPVSETGAFGNNTGNAYTSNGANHSSGLPQEVYTEMDTKIRQWMTDKFDALSNEELVDMELVGNVYAYPKSGGYRFGGGKSKIYFVYNVTVNNKHEQGFKYTWYAYFYDVEQTSDDNWSLDYNNFKVFEDDFSGTLYSGDYYYHGLEKVSDVKAYMDKLTRDGEEYVTDIDNSLWLILE